MKSAITPRLALLACLPMLLCEPGAQAPSAWSELQPPGGVDPSKLTFLPPISGGQIGKLLLYRDGTYLRVFSTITGQWHAHTPSFGTTPVLLGDILMVPENDRWTALSAQRGVFEPLILGSLVPLHPQSTSRFAFLQVGNTVHYFAAAIGSWRSRTLPANGTVSAYGADEQLLVFTGPYPTDSSPGFSGCDVYDTFTDTWYTLPAQPNVTGVRASFSENAGCLLLLSPGQAHAATFTNRQPGWQVRPVNAQPPLFNLGGGGGGGGDLFTLWNVAYSGVTDTLTELNLPVAPATTGLISLGYDTQAQRYYALGIRGQSYLGLPPGSGTMFREGPFGVRIFALGTQSFAFNALDGSTAPVNCDQGPFPSGGHQGILVGGVADVNTREVSVYSVATGQWHPVPPSVLPELPPSTAPAGSDASLLLRDSNGVVAFSGRTGAFVPLAGSGLFRLNGVLAVDPTAVHAFDARTDRWLSAPIAGALSNLERNSGGFVTVSGNRAVAFSVASGHLEALDLPEPIANLGYYVLDGGAFVRTANRIVGFRGSPTIRTGATFPEGAIGNSPGSTFRCQTVVGEGALALLVYSPEVNVSLPLPPFGDLWLDPATAVPLEAIAPPAGELRARSAFAIPDVAVLRGTEWALQALVLPPQGPAYLSDLTSLRIL